MTIRFASFAVLAITICWTSEPLAQAAGCTKGLDADTSSGQDLLNCLIEMQAEIQSLREALDARPETDAAWVQKVAGELAASQSLIPDLKQALLDDPAAVKAFKGDPGDGASIDETMLVPSGAVVAFDGFAGCPAGWEIYTPATARVIVGAGENFHPKHEDWMAQLPTGGVKPTKLEPYVAMSSGGEVEHTLKEDEVLNYPLVVPRRGNVAIRTDNVVDVMVQNVSYGEPREVSPHNNMPPYIALYFCKKK